MDTEKKDRNPSTDGPTLDRRDLMKMSVVGAGVAVAGILNAPAAFAQSGQVSSPIQLSGGLQPVSLLQQWPQIAASETVVTSTKVGYITKTGAGWVNDSGRAFGNGPMDECTKRLVDYTVGFSEKDMTPAVITAVNYLMVDFFACLYSGFESDPGRAGARMSARMTGTGDQKATVFGYGIATTPEMAAFTNGGMGRHSDYDDHNSALIAGVVAVAEMLHSTGAQTMQAIALAYEIQAGLVGTRSFATEGHVEFDNWDIAPATALAAGKLLGLNADQLANAVSLALLPHMPLYSRIGTATMWKGFHAAEQGRNGVWAALIARDGMTGPPEPFEGRDGLISHIGPFSHDLKLPASADGKLAMETGHGSGRGGYKRYATEGTTQGFHDSILPAVREWVKAEDIAEMELENTYYSWQEICDPPKWDPRNRETADHSFPYNIARGILDGYIYFDSFAKEKYMDPKARELMAKLTCKPNPDPNFRVISLRVKKKSGEEKVFPAKNGAPFGNDEIIAKYKRSADFFKLDKTQSELIMKTWMNLHDLKDIREAIAVVTKFGSPRPLSDLSPARIS